MSKGLSSAWNSLTGKDAADAALEASAIAATSEGDKLDYLKETNETSQALKDASLNQLGGIAGLEGFEQYGSQADMMDKAKNSAFYTGQVGASDEAIMRSNNVTGGLRGGGTAVDLANYESDLLNRSYQNELQGIQGLAGLQTNENNIGQSMSNVGSINAQGITAAAQSGQDATNNIMGGLTSLGVAALSDMNLKENIVRIGETSNPEIGVYSWDWKAGSGKEGSDTGFLAQEIEKHYPDYVVTLDDGYKRIYKDKLEEILL